MIARKICLHSLLLVLPLLLCAPAHSIVYVSQSGNNANNGLSWATSKLTIQAGVNLAATQTNKVVWVAVGTLPPPALPSQPVAIPYVENVTIPANVAVYGGFRGDEPASSLPPARALSTIVHPGGGTNAIFCAGTGVAIDGFTIENNQNNALGGGIKCTGTSCAITNDIIKNNWALMGAGVYGSGASIVVDRCRFSGNAAVNTFGPNPSNTTCGGSIFSQGGSVVVRRSTFSGERALIWDISFNSTQFINTASSQGGAVCAINASLVSIDRCVFDGCAATNRNMDPYPTAAFGYGGAIYSTGASLYVTNTVFHGCFANGHSDPQPALGGAIYYHNPGLVQVVNNTFVANEVTPQTGTVSDADRPYGLGGAIYVAGNTSAKIVNNIITKTRGTAVVNNGMIVTFNYNLLWHNAGGDIFGFNFPVQNPPSSTDNNIMKDPQLLAGDPLYHITFGSPAKNAGLNVGSPGFDIDGEVRPAQGVVDIGADEFVDSDSDGGANVDPREISPFSIAPPETDADGDGVYTPYDNCPTNANPHQVDSNGDGIGDVCEGIPEVFYVDAGAAPGGNGLSWATAFRTIQQGIDAADLHNQTNTDGATPWIGVNPEVWVKAGVYNENVMIWHGVQVYGGFNGTEPPPSVNPNVLAGRLPLTNVSEINGGGSKSAVVIAHLPQDRYLKGAVKSEYDLLDTTIDGFLIDNGAAEIGGGVSVYKDYANISSNRVNNNHASLGGGVYMFRSSGTVGDGIGSAADLLGGETTIIGNTAGPGYFASYGGGVYIEQGSPLIFGNIIQGNTARFGGGVAIRKAAPELVDDLVGCQSNANLAVPFGPFSIRTWETHFYLPSAGGGVYMDCKSDAAFEEDTIVGNTAVTGTMPWATNGQGGGLFFAGSDFQMDLTIMAFNTAAEGQEIWGNSPSAQVVLHPLCYITQSDFWPVVASEFVGIPDPTTGGPSPCKLTNLAVDPLFVDPTTCDYHLQPGSPLRLPFANVGAFQDVDP